MNLFGFKKKTPDYVAFAKQQGLFESIQRIEDFQSKNNKKTINENWNKAYEVAKKYAIDGIENEEYIKENETHNLILRNIVFIAKKRFDYEKFYKNPEHFFSIEFWLHKI